MKYNFNIAYINKCTETEGPGKRLAIWFQGCDKRCKGCCNPDLLELKPANIISLAKLLEIVADAKIENDIRGVTFLGGEPTLQAGLAQLSQAIKSLGLGVILFTGKNYSQLSDELKASVDLIVDGEFELENKETERNLIGSTNQKIHYMTDRYRADEKWFYTPRPKQVEVNITEEFVITGEVVFG